MDIKDISQEGLNDLAAGVSGAAAGVTGGIDAFANSIANIFKTVSGGISDLTGSVKVKTDVGISQNTIYLVIAGVIALIFLKKMRLL